MKNYEELFRHPSEPPKDEKYKGNVYITFEDAVGCVLGLMIGPDVDTAVAKALKKIVRYTGFRPTVVPRTD